MDPTLATLLTLAAGAFLTPLLKRVLDRLGIKLPANPTPLPIPNPDPNAPTPPAPAPNQPTDWLSTLVNMLVKALIDRFLPVMEARFEAKMIQALANRPAIETNPNVVRAVKMGDGNYQLIIPSTETVKPEVK